MDATTILAELEREGYVVINTRGTSMQPLLHAGRSHVLIRRLEGWPKKNDVVLYVRPDGSQVLHRVIRLEGDACLIRGDNTFDLERVPLSSVKGVMEGFWRGKREGSVKGLRYRGYVVFWNLLYPFRWLKHQAKQGIKGIARRLFGGTPLAWVVRRAQGSWGGVVLLALCGSVVSVLSVCSALVMREAVDAAVALDRDAFLLWAAAFLAVVVGLLALNAAYRQLGEGIAASMENRVKTQVYDDILRSSYGRLKVFHTGELQNRLTSDARIVADNATSLLPDFMSMLVQLVCAFAVLLMLDWRFASVFLAGGLVLLGVTFLFRRKMKLLHKQVQEADGRLRSWMQESVESLLIVKGFQREKRASEQTADLAAEHRGFRMRRMTFSNVCNVGFGAVMQGGYLFGLVWCCFGILNGTLTYGTLTAVLQLINQIGSPLASLSGFVPAYYAMIASAERLVELERLPKDGRPGGALADVRSLHARNLVFVYDDGEEEVIQNASFDIRRGEVVALTGRSGIGKSTLLKLLLGVYVPVSGRLYARAVPKETKAKGEAGAAAEWQGEPFEVDLNASTRGWFSYVPQGNMLMSGSIYEVVAFLQPAPLTQKQKERVEQVCRIACADEFIRKLPEGYHTVLGEKGSGLSEGQMQRIAIARALYRDAPVLLLDEATSALDEETERRLLCNVKSLEDRTVLIVTHRPRALEICEKQLVFDRARIFVEDAPKCD